MPKKQHNNISPDIYVQRFKKYLSQTKGLSDSTIYNYINETRKFIKFCSKDKHFQIRNLTASIIYNYISKKTGQMHLKVIQHTMTSLRGFIKYLQIRGLCKSILIETLPRISCRKYSKIPGCLSQKDVQKVMNSFKEQTPFGLRNRAMALCLARLGLRSIEVVRLCLEDIDWKSGVINITKNKSRRTDSLPLLKEIGDAIVVYLKKGRPATKDRHVFVNHGNKQGSLISTGVVRYIIRAGFKKACIPIPFRPVHIFRHSLASRMIQQGVTIKEIADILRHRCLTTTMIYTKVDFPLLLEVAMPWPEVIS